MLMPLQDQAGFSLIEVLVAMGLLGIMLIPMTSAYTFSLESLRYSRNRQMATMLAGDCLAQLRATVPYGELPSTDSAVRCDGSSSSGRESFRSPNANFEYETLVGDVNTSGGPTLKEIRIRVYFPTPFRSTKSCLGSSDCSQWDFTTLVAER